MPSAVSKPGMCGHPGPATIRDWKIPGTDLSNYESLHHMPEYAYAMMWTRGTCGTRGLCAGYDKKPNPTDLSLRLEKKAKHLPDETPL